MRTFFVDGWNITQGLNSVQIACLATFLVLLVLVLILFWLLILYRNILKNLTQALAEGEKIARNSLQNRLKRIDDIVTKTPNIAKKHALEIWQTEYKLLIENKFIEQVSFLQKSFIITSMTYPNLRNLRQSKKCLNELKLVSQKIYLIYRQTDKIMAWEMLQRDTRIKVRELFNDLQQDLNEIIENDNFNFDRGQMWEKNHAIDRALNVINRKIVEGNNLVVEAYQEKTNEQIFALIQLLDLFYNCEKLLNNVLPDKLKKIEKKLRLNISDQQELKKNLNKFLTLNNVFDLYRNQIFESLQLLDYDLTFQKLSFISELVANFEIDIQYEERIKDFMVNNLGFLNQLVENLKTNFDNVKISIKYNQELGKSMSQVKLHFLDLQKQYIALNREWNDFYNFWSNIILYQKEYNLFSLEQTLTNLLRELKVIYQELIGISKKIKTKNNLREEIDTKIYELRAVLSTSEVVITKNNKIVDCEKETAAISEIYFKLSLIDTEIDSFKNNLDLTNTNVIIKELEQLIDQAFDIKNEIKNKVLLAVLAESLIVYLDRFASDDNLEPKMGKVLEHYEKNQWNEALNLGIYNLQTYRK